MSEDNGGLIKTFIFAVTFLGLFIALINQMPTGFFTLTDTYFDKDYPDIYDPATLSSLNFTDSESVFLSFPTSLPSGNETDITVGGHTFRISSYDLVSERFIVRHLTQWLGVINTWHSMEDDNGETEFTNVSTSYFFNENSNMSTFSINCEHVEVTCLVGFNTTKYSSYSLAWEGKEIYLTVGIGLDQVTSSTGAWDLVTALLLFQAPNIHPAVNLIINIPIYAMIAIIVFTLITKILPFVG